MVIIKLLNPFVGFIFKYNHFLSASVSIVQRLREWLFHYTYHDYQEMCFSLFKSKLVAMILCLFINV